VEVNAQVERVAETLHEGDGAALRALGAEAGAATK
jgi:hypothetical protein